MPSTSHQRLALAICDFLSTSASDGTLGADEADSIDVAINCIAESFKVDPTDKAAVTEAVGNQNLLKIFGIYEKLKGKNAPADSSSDNIAATTSTAAATGAATTAAAATATATATATAAAPVSEETKKQADGLKSKGNAAMSQKDYPKAIDLYTQALDLTPENAIYLSNRAAAHSAAKDHVSAKADAEAAVAIDPNYTKGWSRLGLAKFALGDAQGSMEAYQKGIEYEGNGGSDAMKKGYETAKRRVAELNLDDPLGTARDVAGGASGAAAGGVPNLSDLAGMMGGGAGGAGGGMPDFSSIMSNPMFASMAQNLMSNPDLMSNLMSNPRLRDMANQFGSGGGLPDMSSLMSDPNIADMARNLMGGGAGGAGGAGAGGAGGASGGSGH